MVLSVNYHNPKPNSGLHGICIFSYITECVILIEDEERQSEENREMYRILFSIPLIEEIKNLA